MAARLVEAELVNLTGHIVGKRSGRVEPRAVKRLPKPHDLLNKPRAEARARLLAHKREKSPQVPAKQAAVPFHSDTFFCSILSAFLRSRRQLKGRAARAEIQCRR